VIGFRWPVRFRCVAWAIMSMIMGMIMVVTVAMPVVLSDMAFGMDSELSLGRFPEGMLD
jgi:hypothetical protein